jgi:hypothetical protein
MRRCKPCCAKRSAESGCERGELRHETGCPIPRRGPSRVRAVMPTTHIHGGPDEPGCARTPWATLVDHEGRLDDRASASCARTPRSRATSDRPLPPRSSAGFAAIPALHDPSCVPQHQNSHGSTAWRRTMVRVDQSSVASAYSTSPIPPTARKPHIAYTSRACGEAPTSSATNPTLGSWNVHLPEVVLAGT